jgi:hypothetical protein
MVLRVSCVECSALVVIAPPFPCMTGGDKAVMRFLPVALGKRGVRVGGGNNEPTFYFSFAYYFN